MKAEKTLAFILLIFDFVVRGSIDHTPEFFNQRGLKIEVQELTASMRTAQLAADAVGASLGCIQPLIFFGNNAFGH